MKRLALSVLCLLSSVLASLSALGPHPVERIRMGETDAAVSYKDKMSDGSYRDSQIVKPDTPVYPGRIALVATNDVPGMWELRYAAYYESGKVVTNSQYVVKTARDRLKTAPALNAPPMPCTNAPPRKDALAHAKARASAAPDNASTNKVSRMGKRQGREVSSLIANGRVVRTMTDGAVIVEPLRVAHTARVTAAPAAIAPPPGKHTKEYLLGFAAGVAAAAAAYGIKRVV